MKATIAALAVLALVFTLQVGGASALDVEPPRAKILFENGGRIVSMDSDGSDREVLTRNGRRPVATPWDLDHDSYPDVSPDGSKFLFLRTTYSKDRQSVMVANRDGSGVRTAYQVDMNPTRDSSVDLISPKFLPDGGIVVVRSSAVFKGRKSRFLDRFVFLGPDGKFRQSRKWVRGTGAFSIDPSPDGGKLLISGWSRGERLRIEALNLRTGKTRVIRRDADAGRWSPDGRSIVFSSEHEKLGKACDYMDGCSYESRVYTMKADGSGVRRVVRGNARGYQIAPDWSPDGRRIVFYSDRNTAELDIGASAEIYTVGVDGSCLTWLTNGSPASTFPVWAPDEGSANPGACGAAGREPLVEMRPRRSTPYWLGPVFGTTMFERDGGVGRGFEVTMKGPFGFRETGLYYTGCIEYSGRDCDEIDYQLGYAGHCRKWPAGILNSGRFASLRVQRGALVMSQKKIRGYLPETLVFTGRNVLNLEAVMPAGRREIHRRMVDAIRPVGGAAGGKLPRPVLDVNLLSKAREIARLRARGVRAADLIKRFSVRAGSVGSWSSFGRALNRVGPVKTARCPKS